MRRLSRHSNAVLALLLALLLALPLKLVVKLAKLLYRLSETTQHVKPLAPKKGGAGAQNAGGRQGAAPVFSDVLVGRSDAMIALDNIYAEGDFLFSDEHLMALDPIIVEGYGSSMAYAAFRYACSLALLSLYKSTCFTGTKVLVCS
jgi:hypothetical protein